MSLPFRTIVAGLALSASSHATAANLLSMGPTAEALSDSIHARRAEQSATLMGRFGEEQKLVGEGETFIHGEGKFGSHMAVLLKRKNGNFFAVKEFLANSDGSVQERAYQLPEDVGPGEISLNGLGFGDDGKPETKIFRHYAPSWGPKVSTAEIYKVVAFGERKLRALEMRSNEFGNLNIVRSSRYQMQIVEVVFKFSKTIADFDLSKSGVIGEIVDAKMSTDHLILTVYHPAENYFETLDVPFKWGDFQYIQTNRHVLSGEEVRQLRIFAETKNIPGRGVPVEGATPAGMTFDPAVDATNIAK